MYQCKYPHLFTPVRLGNTWFRNRLFAAPVGYEYFTEENYPTPEAVAFYERKAMGGAATVCIGSAAVDHRRGVVGKTDICLDDPNALPPVRRLATAISRHGAVANIELQHTGANSYICAARGEQIYGAVAGVNALGMEVPEMPEEIILQTIEAYADAAAFAKFCGFGMVTIHAGHGWLLSQFISPRFNHRTDEFGGSIENRSRFPKMILRALRAGMGEDKVLELRMSAEDGEEGGMTLEDSCGFAEQIDGLVDIFHVSNGIKKLGNRGDTFSDIFDVHGVNLERAAAIKAHLKKSLVSVVGGCLRVEEPGEGIDARTGGFVEH